MSALILLAMPAFAGNSLVCRMALTRTGIDAASFTSIRIFSGALVLCLIVRRRTGSGQTARNWLSAFALFAYAAAFSMSSASLSAATGTLPLLGAVQATMIGHGLRAGERLGGRQLIGLPTASAGLVGLQLPGLSAPPLHGSLLMLVAGVAWGAYSLRGKGAGDPLRVTAGNLLRAAVFTAGLSMVMPPGVSLDPARVAYAIASGALASGVGYAIWYTALRELHVTRAATVQQSVPVIAAAGGIVFLDEPLTYRLLMTSAAVIVGVALVIFGRRRTR